GRSGRRWSYLLLVMLGADELVEPPDLAFDRLQTMALEFQRVSVDPLPGLGDLLADQIQPLFQTRPAAFEDPQADRRVGAPEEGEVDPEVLVLPGGRPGVGEQALEARLPGRGQLVDDLRPTVGLDPARLHHRTVLYDPATGDQTLQTRIERAVREGTERPEQQIEPLAQLITVHRGLVQQAQHGELEYSRALGHRALPSRLSVDVSLRYIPTIDR